MLVCKNIQKGYKTTHGEKISVLKGINISIDKGDIVVISGRSGTGKSTFLNILSGLDSADSGHVCFREENYNNLSNSELTKLRYQSIGIIFQSYNLISSWTVFENVEAALLYENLTEVDKNKRIMITLNNLEIGQLYNNFPAELSAGQRQRVAVARAIISEPDIIFADEPTGDVDFETAKQIIRQLLFLVHSRNISLVIFTHGSFPMKMLNKDHRYKHYKMIDGKLDLQETAVSEDNIDDESPI